MPLTSSGSPTLSSRVMRGLSEPNGSWKIIWISARSGSSSACGRAREVDHLAGRACGRGSRRRSDRWRAGCSARRWSCRSRSRPPGPASRPRSTVKSTPSTARTWPTVRCRKPCVIGKNFCRPRTSRRRLAAARPASLTRRPRRGVEEAARELVGRSPAAGWARRSSSAASRRGSADGTGSRAAG